MKLKIFSLFAFLLFLLLILFLAFSKINLQEQTETEKVISVGKIKIIVEVADTDEKRSQGLSGRISLLQDRGMLFVFSQKQRHLFWMKDMKFSLDFIWIDGNRVVNLTENVPFPKEGESPYSLVPKVPVDKVLEVSAGIVEKSGIKIGDQIDGL